MLGSSPSDMRVLRLLHPIAPFITAELWDAVAPVAGRKDAGSSDTVATAAYPQAQLDRVDEKAIAHVAQLKALVGVTRGRAIGVDVEVVRPSVDIDLVARRQFAPGEVSRLFNVSGAERTAVFYTCWTRKEAYLKARGERIIGRLQDFEMSCLPGETPEIRWAKAGAGERSRWLRGVLITREVRPPNRIFL